VQSLRLRQRRLEAHRCEELARLAQRLLRLGLAEGGQAAALTEQGVGALGHVPEGVPALGRLSTEGGGFGVLAGGFGELGAAGRARVLLEWCDGLDPGDEAGSERGLGEGERAAHEFVEDRGGVRVGAGAGSLVEFGEQRPRLLRTVEGAQEPGGGRERERDDLRLTALVRPG
jgi:hypothetical protein